MKRLHLLTLLSCCLAIVVFLLKRMDKTTISMGKGQIIPSNWLAKNHHPLTPKKDIRTGYITFLSYPEWHLVFCPEEQALYFKNKTATSFDFMKQTHQIWEGYEIVNNQVKKNFKPNEGYHLMIWVIGVSSSAEYGIKSWYETVVGKLTDTEKTITDEDKFNAYFTDDYVKFIKDKPWYEYDFKSKLRELWSNTSFFDSYFLRKMERKYILTSELLVKYGYGKLIGMGSQSIYGKAKETTPVVLADYPKSSTYKIEQAFGDSCVLINLPRYHRFNAEICKLVKNGAKVKEVGGNTSAILVTVLADKKYYNAVPSAKKLFVQPIPSFDKQKRIGYAVLIPNLDEFISQMDKENIQIEHIYDF